MKSFYKLSFAVFVLIPYVHLRSLADQIADAVRPRFRRIANAPRLQRRFHPR